MRELELSVQEGDSFWGAPRVDTGSGGTSFVCGRVAPGLMCLGVVGVVTAHGWTEAPEVSSYTLVLICWGYCWHSCCCCLECYFSYLKLTTNTTETKV